MTKPNQKLVLGRGLSALLKDPTNDIKSISDKNANQIVGRVIDVDISSIELNPYQPRTNFRTEDLEELASSLKTLGLIQPITVRKLGFGKYQLISGERRLRASKILEKTTIPAFVRLANDQEVLEMALVENIQRQDLDAIEIALSYQRLINDIKLTQEEMSARVGKKRSTISNYLRLLKLDPIVQTGIRDGFLSMGHGRALINIENKNKQIKIYRRIITQSLSVRETEALVKDYQEGTTHKTPSKEKLIKDKLPEYISLGKKYLEKQVSQEVEVKLSGSTKGKILIPFSSKEQFEQLISYFEK